MVGGGRYAQNLHRVFPADQRQLSTGGDGQWLRHTRVTLDGVDRTKGIAPLFSMQENYAQLRGPAVLARRRATDHGTMLYSAGGYMAAWFLYTLSNDRQAAQVFTGAQAEIRRNANWQDVETKNLR